MTTNAFRRLMQSAAPARLNADRAAMPKTSEWAQRIFPFTFNARQVELLDSNARYLAVCCNRQWGKTTGIALKALHHALTRAGITVVIISRTKSQAGLVIERTCEFAARLGYRTRRVLGHRYSLRLPNASKLFAVAHTEDSSVGNTADILVIDEAALVSDGVYFATSPFISRTRGAIWLLSTPQRPAGFFFNIWHDDDPRWHKIFSTVKDCPDIDPDFLAFFQRADPIKYSQYFECEFIQPRYRLFTRELLEAMRKPIPPGLPLPDQSPDPGAAPN